MFDIIIRGGRVLDGTGTPAFKADVGIKDGKIAAVDDLINASGRSLDATGFVVAPGFIDMHSHSDLALLANPRAESKIRQGVTTEVIGNCGESAAPLTPRVLADFKKESDLDKLQIELDWLSMGEYLAKLQKQGIALNVVPLVGHGTIRAAVMGYENRRPATVEMREMKTLIEQAMQEGAFGMSTGLIYARVITLIRKN
jgi:N-acyl-D-aspartate/D-glutamate deacylase